MQNEFNWIDLSEYGLQIILTKLPNGKKFLVAWGADEQTIEPLEQIGFIARKGDPSVMFASREKLGDAFFARLKQFLPKSKAVKLPIEQVVVPDLAAWAKTQRAKNSGEVSKEKMSQDLTELRVELSQDRFLGVNARDEKVYKTPEGRVCVGVDGAIKMMNFKSDKSLFLIAGDKKAVTSYQGSSNIALFKAIEPFAKEIAEGKIYHFDDLKRIVEIIYDLDDGFDKTVEYRSDAGAGVLQRVEQALSLAVEQYALNQFDFDDENELGDAVDSLFERIPKTPASYFEKEYLVMGSPPAQSDLIKKLVIARNAKSITITPSLPGYLEASLPKTTKVNSYITPLVDFNPAISEMLNPTAAPNVAINNLESGVSIDTELKQDFLFLNELPGTMAKKTFDGVTFTRKDLYQSAYNLMAMDDDGSAVIAIQEPLEANNNVDGEYKEFLEWLYPRYGVKGAVQVDGSLYGRSAEKSNVRLLYVEGRNLIPELDMEIPTSLIEINDFAALRNLSNAWLTEEAKESLDENQTEERKATRLSDILSTKDDSIKLKANKHQKPYITTSKVQSGDAMVNKDLELPTRKAHAKLVRDVGDIDQYVAEKLQMTEDQLHRVFFGEQVASIAQMIYNIEHNKSFLLGDAPGQGKGRQIAAATRFRLLRGETVLFVTENADLFRDIMRDLDDIESAHLVKPYVVDNKKSVTMMDGTVLDEGSKERNDVLLQGHIDTKNYNMIFSTYVQLRPIRENKTKNNFKSRQKVIYKDSHQYETIQRIARQNGGIGIIADESHNAASLVGNTNDVMERLLDLDAAAVLSSGTHARHDKNLSFYHRQIDIVSSREEFREILTKGGANVTSAFVQMLAEAGMYVRREEDLSKAGYRSLKDVTPVNKTKQIIDSTAEVFSLMGALTNASKKHVFNNDKEDELTKLLESFGGRLGSKSALSMGSTHFSSRFNNLQHQLINTLSVPTVIEGVKQSVQNNEKPIITFNNTGASFNERYVEKMIAIAEALKEDPTRSVNPLLADNIPNEVDGEWVFNRVPQFKEVLFFAIEDVMRFKISTNNGKNAVYVELGDLCTNDEGSLAIAKAKEEIIKAIQNVPNVPYAPIDILYDELTKAGLNCQEITGRKKGFQATSDGKWTYSSLDKMEKNQVIDGFNNGLVDVAMINAAGGTGFSYHAAPADTVNGKHLDGRVRTMFFLEYMADVLKAKQIENRINRKGQLENPNYAHVELDFPVAKLLLGIQNTKRQQFSACVTGSSDADVKLRTDADIINPVGDKVTLLFLEENPDITSAMGFDIDGFVVDGKYQFDGFATRFKDALIRLPYDKQNEVLSEVMKSYHNEIEYLNAIGNNMLNKSSFNFGAKTLRETILSGDASDFRESAFDTPVKVREIEYKPKLKNNAETIALKIKSGIPDFQESVKEHGFTSFAELVNGMTDYLDNNRASFIDKLKNPDPKLIREYDEKIDAVKNIIPKLFVGQVVQYKDEFDRTKEVEDSVIVSIDIAAKNPMEWSIRLDTPGSDYSKFVRVRDIVKDYIQNSKTDNKDEPLITFTGREFTMNSDLARAFSNAKKKFATERRCVLVGNPIKIVQEAMALKAGTNGSYTDDKGTRHACVMLPKGMSYNDVISRPQKIESVDNALKYLAYNLTKRSLSGVKYDQVTFDTSTTGYSQTQDVKLTVNTNSDVLTVVYPKNKKYGEAFKHQAFNQSLGPGARIEGKKAYNVATTDLSNLENVLRYIYNEAELQFTSTGDDAKFENKIINGEIVVDTKTIVNAFDGTSYLDEVENSMSM